MGTFFLGPPFWADAESEDPLCRIAFNRNKIMDGDINNQNPRIISNFLKKVQDFC